MFEDKLKTTDWEATNEAIEEQIARESYLQWCRDNMQRSRSTNTAAGSATSSTVTSAEALTDSDASPSKYSSDGCGGGSSSKNNNSSSNSATTLSNSNVGDGPATGYTLSPKTLSQFTHKLPPDVNELGGYDSDATDMSSTSSVGHCAGGNASPNTAAVAAAQRKLSKSQRRSNGLRGSKKRRHEAREGGGRFVMCNSSQKVLNYLYLNRLTAWKHMRRLCERVPSVMRYPWHQEHTHPRRNSDPAPRSSLRSRRPSVSMRRRCQSRITPASTRSCSRPHMPTMVRSWWRLKYVFEITEIIF